jgi:hypothetical protein
MRTLQEKYNAIQEGKFSKEHFLAEARMQQPQLITRFNGYDDTVQILKNKGMIQEAVVEEARLTKNSLTDYRYKPTNEMDKYPYEQILRGIRVELETMDVFGTPTADEYAKALAKVSKNLAKDSIFYTNQVAGNNKKVDLHDKMVDATAKNTVDTFNGLKKAELKEGFKKLIKKVLSEGNEFGEGEDVYEMYGSDRRIPDDTYIGDNTWYDEEEDEIDYDDENFSDPFIDGDEADDIPHPRGYEEASDEEDFDDLFKENKSEKELRAEWEKHQATSHPEDKMSYMEWRSEQGLDEAVDIEADKDMVRKFMTMYKTEPSKFERLHKQAQTQAATTKDIKFKHLLSLLNRAKAGSVQPKEIPGFEGTRDALDNLFESKSLKDLI